VCSEQTTGYISNHMLVACRLASDDDQLEDPNRGICENATLAEVADHPPRSPSATAPPNDCQRSKLGGINLVGPAGHIRPRQRALSDVQNQNSGQSIESDAHKPRKRRPLSWFPPSGTVSGRVSHLPKHSTDSPIEKSIISAPILTSTTNAKVALAEGVHFGKLTASGVVASPRHSGVGTTSNEGGANLSEENFHQTQGLQSPNRQRSQPDASKLSRDLCSGPSKRSASMNVVVKVKDALRSGLRKASDPRNYRSVFGKDKFVRLDDDCRAPLPINDRFARIRTEGRNLGRDKIRVLTGHGHVKRKPLQQPGQNNGRAVRDGKGPLLGDGDDSSVFRCGYADHTQQEVDFHFEDLEASFARAVDKLDFCIKRDKASLTSLSSFFHAARTTSAPDKTRAPQPLEYPNPGSCHHLSAHAVRLPYDSSPACATSDHFAPAHPSMGQCASRTLKWSSGRAKASPELQSTPCQTNAASNEEIEKADRSARAERIFSRGHANPLASHPDVMEFASPPIPTIAEGKSGIQIKPEPRDPHKLEGGPIYSPSLETLSQYSRNTPSSAHGSTTVSSRKLQPAISRRRLVETPTRPARRIRDRPETTAEFFSNLPSAPSHDPIRTFNKHDENSSPRVKAMQASDLADGGNVYWDRALERKEQNMVEGIKQD
jgi:hypothetical protein